MKYAAIRRPPVGKARVIERGLTLARANALLIAGHCDQIEPDGFRDSLAAFGPRFVLLAGKRPVQANWPHVVPTEHEVEAHSRSGKNIGIKAGNGLAILDFDNQAAEAEMLKTLGPLTPTVETGSGKRHYYVAGSDTLPAKLRWKGEIVGEIQRTSAQQVVAPPSVHPDTGREYVWLTAPGAPLQELPKRWLVALAAGGATKAIDAEVPDYIKLDDPRGHEADGSGWDGPDADVILERASKQPGARRRAGGWKFACAGCQAEGHDKHRDNAIVRPDGRWGCAIDPAHKRAIGAQLGMGLIMQTDDPTANDDPEDSELDLPMQDNNPEAGLKEPT